MQETEETIGMTGEMTGETTGEMTEGEKTGWERDCQMIGMAEMTYGHVETGIMIVTGMRTVVDMAGTEALLGEKMTGTRETGLSHQWRLSVIPDAGITSVVNNYEPPPSPLW
eukprot:TRINITY_DN2847_c0_g1_i4.p1 TRINITY_DN2847_c0_g1~~TRINITY_DN2847_c0_g1_i4.p1  ORF type:complete len:112 (-),score=23.06 TRINITY_DN2847_c0_g1_i4:134-469(-)